MRVILVKNYSRTLPHAVSAASGNTYTYDCNGNMISRNVGGQAYTLRYDAENHLVGVSGAATATFVYDGDGARVKSTINGTTIVYLGDYVEWNETTSTLTKYYYAGEARIAVRGTYLRYLLSDHLGSTTVSITGGGADPSLPLGTGHSELRYKPWGETRYTDGNPPTKRQFTGQINESALGLYFFNARWYDPALSRFTSADTLVPEPGEPQAWDRYAFVYNNPVRYSDPSGHDPCLPKHCGYMHDYDGSVPLPQENEDWPWGNTQSPDDNWVDLSFDWLLEHGEEVRIFDEHTLMTKNLMGHPGVGNARKRFREFLSSDESPQIGSTLHYTYDFGAYGYVEAWFNLDGTGHFLGSYEVFVTYLGNGKIGFMVVNESNLASFTNLRLSSVDISLVENIETSIKCHCFQILPFKTILPDWKRGETFWGYLHLGGNFKQIYHWTETIP